MNATVQELLFPSLVDRIYIVNKIMNNIYHSLLYLYAKLIKKFCVRNVPIVFWIVGSLSWGQRPKKQFYHLIFTIFASKAVF